MTDNNNPLNWDIKEEVDKKQLEQRAKQEYEENIHFLRAFSTDSGKQVMEWLVKYTLDTPTWFPGQSTDRGFFREGQNSLVRQIKSKIEQAITYEVNNANRPNTK